MHRRARAGIGLNHIFACRASTFCQREMLQARPRSLCTSLPLEASPHLHHLRAFVDQGPLLQQVRLCLPAGRGARAAGCMVRGQLPPTLTYYVRQSARGDRRPRQ